MFDTIRFSGKKHRLASEVQPIPESCSDSPKKKLFENTSNFLIGTKKRFPCCGPTLFDPVVQRTLREVCAEVQRQSGQSIVKL
jgi:hypothetical protein